MQSDLQGKRYICLARASDTSEGTTSTEAQVALLNAYALQRGMLYVDKVVLDNVTGSLPGRRKDLDELLARKKSANDFDVLVVQRLDRLTRSGSGHGFWIEHEWARAGIQILVVGDDIPEGPYANLIKVAKYEAAREQAFSISQRSTQGAQLAMEEGRNVTSARTPYGCWRLYLTADGTPSHIMRDLRDGRQQKLHAETYEVIDTYGHVGGGAKGHYRKQKSERTLLMPGDRDQVEVVREIFDMHFVQGWGGKRIAGALNVTRRFTVILCTDSDSNMREYFLRSVSSVVLALDNVPSRADIVQAINTLVELFRSMSQAPRKSVQGLWAELFVLAQAPDPLTVIPFWHTLPENRYDFTAGVQRVEVKSAAGRVRSHHFSLDQVRPPAGTRVLVASVFVEPAAGGTSVLELFEEMRAHATGDIASLLHLDRVLRLSLGSAWRQGLQERFDRQLAGGSLRFFDTCDVPAINAPIPPQVSDIHFRVDLTGLQPIDVAAVANEGGMFQAILDTRGHR